MVRLSSVRGCWPGALLLASLSLCVAIAASAQQMVHSSDPDARAKVDQFEQALKEADESNTLSCTVSHRQPRLNFAFRYFAGYRASLPIAQFPTGQFELLVLLRVSPDAGDGAYYFWQRFNVPPGKRPKGARGEFSGGFFLGEGGYSVEWLIFEEQGRACRGRWRTELKLKQQERNVADFMQPGSVAPMTLTWAGTADGRERPYQVAVVLHATPVFPRSIRLTEFDQSFLTTMLTTLFEDTPFRESSLYAVNLEKQDVIFEATRLDPDSFMELVESMRDLSLGTIGIDEYSNPAGRLDVLARIVNREAASEAPPDAIVFIGPNSRYMQKFPPELLESVPGKKPQFFYLHLDYFSRRFPWPDIIERLTKGQGGKVFSIREPKQLIKALNKMEELLARQKAGSL